MFPGRYDRFDSPGVRGAVREYVRCASLTREPRETRKTERPGRPGRPGRPSVIEPRETERSCD
eukprot:5256117-Pyramimonas_sp.AAC.1